MIAGSTLQHSNPLHTLVSPGGAYTMAAKIMIVDDDENIRDILLKLLSLEGYETVAAVDGSDALQKVIHEQPDLILMDVSMPNMDGYEVCRQFKASERTAHIPVTFLTFQGETADRQRGIAVGAADYLSKPIEQDVLLAHVRSQLRALKMPHQFETNDSVIFTLALQAESRDTYTSGHLRRMEHYSTQLAMAAGLSDDDVRAIRYGAILHDVGKLRVSESILTKHEPLTREEFAEIKRHPEHGAQMISHLRFARKVVPIVLSHHEKWNGKGYPRGLMGTRIPVGGRIVAIADAYDAMTTDRPYRRALSQQEALRRLRAHSGIQWDPQLVPIFYDLVEQDRLELPTNDTSLLISDMALKRL